MEHQYDVFIAHASEDKAAFVSHLAEGLRAYGLKVWYDDFAIELGDGLLSSINRGLKDSDYGVVILSPRFFAKHWPQEELAALAQRQADGKSNILPVWLDLDLAGIKEACPLLADVVATKACEGLNVVADKIIGKAKPSCARRFKEANLSPYFLGGQPALAKPFYKDALNNINVANWQWQETYGTLGRTWKIEDRELTIDMSDTVEGPPSEFLMRRALPRRFAVEFDIRIHRSIASPGCLLLKELSFYGNGDKYCGYNCILGYNSPRPDYAEFFDAICKFSSVGGVHEDFFATRQPRPTSLLNHRHHNKVWYDDGTIGWELDRGPSTAVSNTDPTPIQPSCFGFRVWRSKVSFSNLAVYEILPLLPE